MELDEDVKCEDVPVDIMTARGFGWRVAVSIIMGVSWLAFLIIWLFFFAGDYNVYQNIGIIILSILIIVVVLGALWASWISVGMRYASKEDREMWGMKGFKTAVAFSAVVGFATVLFLVIWLFFYAVDFNIYQNIAVLVVVVLIAGGIMAAFWAPWGMKYASKEDREKWGVKGFKSRVVFSAIVCFATLIFLIIWLFFYAADFNVYQNIAILIVVVLVAGGISGASWAPWGMRRGKRLKT